MLDITIRIRSNVIREGKIVQVPGEILLEGRSKAGVSGRQTAEAILSGAAEMEEVPSSQLPVVSEESAEMATLPVAKVIRKR